METPRTADSPDGSPVPLTTDDEFLRALTLDAQEWSAGVLAEAEGGRLDVRSSDVEKIYELRLKGVNG